MLDDLRPCLRLPATERRWGPKKDLFTVTHVLLFYTYDKKLFSPSNTHTDFLAKHNSQKEKKKKKHVKNFPRSRLISKKRGSYKHCVFYFAEFLEKYFNAKDEKKKKNTRTQVPYIPNSLTDIRSLIN